MTHPMMLEGTMVSHTRQSHAPQLVIAIQSCIAGRVRAVIAQLKALAEDEVKHLKGSDRLWSRKNYVNDRLSGDLDLTALHLAAKAYSAHTKDRNLASVFNEMVGDLLAAGADPWLEVGARSSPCRGLGLNKTQGQTVVEVCEGRIPPALSAWIIEQTEAHWNLEGYRNKTTERVQLEVAVAA